jgi:hypothetical protein
MLRRYRKPALAVVLAAAVALLLLLNDRPPAPSDSAAPPPGAPVPAQGSLMLPERQPLTTYRPAAPEPPPRPKVATAPPPAEPRMPPVPYRYAGMLGQQVLLAKDTAIVAVSPGEVLDQVYRVDAIDENGVSLTYLPLGKRVVIGR